MTRLEIAVEYITARMASCGSASSQTIEHALAFADETIAMELRTRPSLCLHPRIKPSKGLVLVCVDCEVASA